MVYDGQTLDRATRSLLKFMIMHPKNATCIALVAAAFSLVVALFPTPARAASDPPLTTDRGVVASDNPIASRVGAAVLAAGGNAADAAAATALALGVVSPLSSGIGGGGFAVVHMAESGETHAIDFREMAPAALTPDDFVRDGKPDTSLSQKGGLAVGVPGEVAGLGHLVDEFGVLSLRRAVAPACRLALKGFGLGWFVATKLPHLAESLDDPDETAAWAFSGGEPAERGDKVSRPRLARTLEQIARHGTDGFYEGPVARDIIATVKEHGGVMTLEDLERYEVVERDPVVGRWGDYTLRTMPLPSSGGIVILEALGIVEATGFDLAAHGPQSSATKHILAEALKHAFADRARYLGGDVSKALVRALLDEDRLEKLARRVSQRRVRKHRSYGSRDLAKVTGGGNLDDSGTSHLCVIDADGNAVALTTTINLHFGAKVVGDKSGVVLNNEIDDFAIAPGKKNAFGLVQSEANLVGPKKRPLSSMSPTLVFEDGEVVGFLGGSGGPMIIANTFQVFLNAFAFDMDAEEAVSAPRIHHQWIPNKLLVEDAPEDVVRALERRGHEVEVNDYKTAVQLIRVREDGTREAASDPRKGGRPAAQRASR